MSARLSIVIPSHNRPDLLRQCLASVIQYAPSGAEIIVVDDGSANGIIRDAAEAFHEVRAIRLPRQRGFCIAANTGIRAASHPIVELLNDDTEVMAGWANAALAWFEDASVAAVAPLVLQNDREIIDSAGDRYHIAGVAGKRGHGQPVSSAYLQPRRVFGASASSAFYRREALQKVGTFPEEFGSYFEDVDLAFRLNRAGYQVVFEPASRVQHRIGSSHRPRRRLLEQQSRNEELVFWRNVPGRALLGALPLHLAVLAGKAWLRWRDGGLLPFLSGRLRVLGELPRLVRHRRGLTDSDTNVQQWAVDTGVAKFSGGLLAFPKFLSHRRVGSRFGFPGESLIYRRICRSSRRQLNR